MGILAKMINASSQRAISRALGRDDFDVIVDSLTLVDGLLL